MPVTANLARRFYEAFGDEITNELVDWFNGVNLTRPLDLIGCLEGDGPGSSAACPR